MIIIHIPNVALGPYSIQSLECNSDKIIFLLESPKYIELL
jgi:hypothetical protein